MRSASWSSRLGLLLAVGALGCGGSDPLPSTPSILLVTLDTLRLDHVGAYTAGAGWTPNLDAVARQGLVHENAFTTIPATGPAHLSLFTGVHPSVHGSRRNGVPLRVSQTSRDLSAKLAAAGYATAAFTTTAVLSRRNLGLHGFEVIDAPGGEGSAVNLIRSGASAVTSALAWLEAEDRRPVLLWVQLYDPHAPYGNAQEKQLRIPLDWSDYGWVDRRRFATGAERTRVVGLYGDGVRDLDDALGTLLEGVRREIRGPLLVVAVADHGESLDEHLDTRGYAWDHGAFLDPETVRIPLLLAGAGVEPGRSAGAVSIRDLYPTLLRVAGVEEPDTEHGEPRDLRQPSSARRIVTVERRDFESDVRAEVRQHSVVATDGDRLLRIAEDGSVSAGSSADSPDLLAAARARAAVSSPAGAAPDAATRAQLRALGYAE